MPCKMGAWSLYVMVCRWYYEGHNVRDGCMVAAGATAAAGTYHSQLPLPKDYHSQDCHIQHGLSNGMSDILVGWILHCTEPYGGQQQPLQAHAE
jgi:hypothetical protein